MKPTNQPCNQCSSENMCFSDDNTEMTTWHKCIWNHSNYNFNDKKWGDAKLCISCRYRPHRNNHKGPCRNCYITKSEFKLKGEKQ